MLAQLLNKYPDSDLLKYIEQCKNGTQIIGHELMLQLDMLLEHFDNPDIKIDFKPAHRRIRFIEGYCKHF